MQNTGEGWMTQSEGKEKPTCEYDVEVVLNATVHQKIMLLQEAFNGVSEWLGYLLGEVGVEGGRITVDDIVIPKQKATLGSVDGIEPPEPAQIVRIVGTVHSHGHKTGKPSPSGTDTSYIGANHPLMMVVGENYHATARLKAPCGLWKVHDCTVIIRCPELAEFIADAREKVEIAHYVGYPYGGYGGLQQSQLPGWADYEGYPW